MDDNQDDSCPCGSGKLYEQCCKIEYDRANAARDKLKAALNNPDKNKELQALLKTYNKEK